MAALLRGADPRPEAVVEHDGRPVVVLRFRHDFHRRKILEAANCVLVEKALRRVLGALCHMRCAGPD